MIYDVRHVTTYAYESPAGATLCTLRLTPRQTRAQHVENARIEIAPGTAAVATRDDFFGNHVTRARIAVAHRELKLIATSRVRLERRAPAGADTPPWERIVRGAAAAASLSAAAPAHGLFPSRYAPLVDEVVDWTRASFPAGRPVLEGATDLMARIRREFRYVSGATSISTPIAEVFKARAGVCQDFAHLMIAGLRGLGLPALYVSGYIRTVPPPGKPRLEGADASHAWVRVWCGGEAGWVGLDPTNALVVADDHVTLAYGRDYADVSPVDGIFVGSGAQKLTVAVDVKPVAA